MPVLLAVAGCGASGRRGGSGGPDADSGRPSASSGTRDGDESGDSGGGPGVELGVDVSIGGGSGSGSGSDDDEGSGGGDGGNSGSGEGDAAVKQPPVSDPTTEAFRRVRVGSCLPIHRTGPGSAWNVDVPPEAVSCGSRRAGLFRVTRTGGGGVSCEAGKGRTSWSYYSRAGAAKLCLERIWVERYCILGNNTSDGMSLGTTTAVDCRAKRVPKPYDHVLVVAGVYRAPSDAGSKYCREGSSDGRTYWSLVAANRTILVCFTYPNS